MSHGTPVIFAAGRLRFASDDYSKQFADNLLRTLKAVRERVGDMYLVHGGDMKGIERLAASWAEQNGIQQLRFGLDRKLGDRAGFRRNAPGRERVGCRERSEEHTSELQSLMRISYAVFCLKQKTKRV